MSNKYLNIHPCHGWRGGVDIFRNVVKLKLMMFLTWIVWRKRGEGGAGYPAACCTHCSSSGEERLQQGWHSSPEARETQCWPWSADPENILDFMNWTWKYFPGRNGMERMCRYHFLDNLTRDIFNQGNLISLQRPQFFPLVFCWEAEKQRRSSQQQKTRQKR